MVTSEKCKYICSKCPFDDCTFDGVTLKERKLQDEFDKEMLPHEPEELKNKYSSLVHERSKKGSKKRADYRKTDTCKLSKKKYAQSDKGKIAVKRYQDSDKGKIARIRYEQSEKGKLARSEANKRCYQKKKAERQAKLLKGSV